MAEVVRMPLLSDTMTEGVIAAWHKEIGEKVESGELLAEIETDKATMEFESFDEGVLLYRAPLNASIPVNAILAIIGEAGEDIQGILGAEKAPTSDSDSPKDQQTASPVPISVEAPKVEEAPKVAAPTDGRLKASPLAKKLAKENQIDLLTIRGSGGEGRIIKRDIEAVLLSSGTSTQPIQVTDNQTVIASISSSPSIPVAAPAVASHSGEFEDVRVSQMRKTIARRLAESKFSAPHFYLRMTIGMDKIMDWRKSMNEHSPVKISFNDVIVKAAAMALRQNPAVNSSWLGDKIRFNKNINIGVAVAVDEGLLVPVLRSADQKSLSELSRETRELAGKAKEKKLQPTEMQGNTFTISNLGMFDIDEFTAIINPPDACIMAVGKIAAVPAVIDGEIGIAHQMKVTLSCDHRVVDGVVGSKFLQTFKGLLESPIRLLI